MFLCVCLFACLLACLTGIVDNSVGFLWFRYDFAMISLRGTCTTDKRLGKFEDDNDMIDTCVGRVKYSHM